MTEKEKNPAQEVQEAKPVAGEDAALFEEIGVTVPPTEAQTVQREIMNKRYELIWTGKAENLTELDIAEINELLKIAATRIDAIKAGEDNGNGLKRGLRRIQDRLNAIKEEPGADLAAVAAAEEKAVELAQDVQELIVEFGTIPGLDALQGWSVKPYIPPVSPAFEAVAGMKTAFDAVAAAKNPIMDIVKGINSTINAINGSGAFETIGRTVQQIGEWAKLMQERIADAEKTFTEFMQSEKGEKVKQVFSDFGAWATDESRGVDEKLWLLDFIENIDELLPFAEQELERLHREKGVDSFTFEEFIRDTDPETGEAVQSLLELCIERANAARAAKEETSSEPQQKTYRTKAKAIQSSAETLKGIVPFITAKNYQHATSLHQSGNAYLQPVSDTTDLIFNDGKLYFRDFAAFGGMREATEIELQNIKTKEGIESIDLPLLRSYYGIILGEFQKADCRELKPVITLYVPELAEYLGLQRNLNKADIAGIIAKTQEFHHIVGVMHETRNGKPTSSLYPVLNFEGYNDKTNEISFSSPYLNRVIEVVFNEAIRRDKKGAPLLKSNGTPLTRAWNSYLVKSAIAKERNKAAVENVFIICALIEQTGRGVPNISAREIINRNPQLKERLEKHTQPNKLLKQTFTKTWELLRTMTTLQDTYKGITLPDPKNPADIPTKATLSTVYRFPHKGKKKDTEAQEVQEG